MADRQCQPTGAVLERGNGVCLSSGRSKIAIQPSRSRQKQALMVCYQTTNTFKQSTDHEILFGWRSRGFLPISTPSALAKPSWKISFLTTVSEGDKFSRDYKELRTAVVEVNSKRNAHGDRWTALSKA